MNLGTFLTRRAILDPEALGFVDGNWRLTFAAAEWRARQAATVLQAAGVQAGTPVGVLLQNSLEWVEVFFAAARLGAVIVPLNWRLSGEELAAICEDAGVRTLICAAVLPAAGQLRARRSFQTTLVVGEMDGSAPAYAPLVEAAAPAPPYAVGGDEDPLLIIYTSGTTGRLKGAVHTHRTWYWASATVAATMDFRARDRALVMMPMYHVGGLIMTTIHVHLGVASVLLPTFDAATVLRLIEEERVAHFLCVPTMLGKLRDDPRYNAADLTSLRWVMAAAAPVPVVLIEQYARRGVSVLQAYGLTESGGPATVTPNHAALRKAGSVGVPYFHTEVRVVDESGRHVAPGAVGEVEVRGRHVFAGYWDNPQATRASFHDGWLRTGDLGRLDEEGYLYLVDRKHDTIISGGENIYPTEVEQVLQAHPAVADAAVLGLPDPVWGEVVCAAIVPRAPGGPSEADMIAFCRTRLAGYKVPRRVFLVESLPRTPTGKVLRRELRARLEVPR